MNVIENVWSKNIINISTNKYILPKTFEYIQICVPPFELFTTYYWDDTIKETITKIIIKKITINENIFWICNFPK